MGGFPVLLPDLVAAALPRAIGLAAAVAAGLANGLAIALAIRLVVTVISRVFHVDSSKAKVCHRGTAGRLPTDRITDKRVLLEKKSQEVLIVSAVRGGQNPNSIESRTKRS